MSRLNSERMTAKGEDQHLGWEKRPGGRAICNIWVCTPTIKGPQRLLARRRQARVSTLTGNDESREKLGGEARRAKVGQNPGNGRQGLLP
ncbi:hypothetical protein VSDG_01160 [Cytospora chrysosperma]|uniref:Uncharacterized protein n=1 Tax=Cytospora chrysosperma TaxID=252740 RepID=A0A423WL70_CYTCH|nr:hypothetical protein VSDG_01160 [Valsa sordida]